MPTIIKVVQDINLPDLTIGQNTYWLKAAETLTAADAANVEADLDAWLKQAYEQMTAAISNTLSYGGYTVRTVDQVTGDETFFTQGDANIAAGGSTDGQMPNINTAVCGALPPGRSRPAIKHIAGINENTVVENSITAGTLGLLLLYALDWKNGPSSAGATVFTWTSGIWSRKDLAFYDFGTTAYARIPTGKLESREAGQGI